MAAEEASYVREASPCIQRGPDQQGLPLHKKTCVLANRCRQLSVTVLACLHPFAKRCLFLPPVHSSEGLPLSSKYKGRTQPCLQQAPQTPLLVEDAHALDTHVARMPLQPQPAHKVQLHHLFSLD